MTRLILASASPRRRALLAALGIEFNVSVSNAEETFDGAPAEMVVRNARAKCQDVAKTLEPGPVVLGADTLVFVGEHVLGKPADDAEARAMLTRLSGETHQVLTGLSLLDTKSGRSAEGCETTDVTFRDLTPAEIDIFVHTVNPVDRAGAYTVDGPGSLLVARYNGCYQNVLGLPIVRLDCLLREIGHNLFEWMEPARCRFL